MSEREAQMRFPNRTREHQRVVGKYVETIDNREVVKSIRVYVGRRKAARA